MPMIIRKALCLGLYVELSDLTSPGLVSSDVVEAVTSETDLVKASRSRCHKIQNRDLKVRDRNSRLCQFYRKFYKICQNM